jgi:hypothetical protein
MANADCGRAKTFAMNQINQNDCLAFQVGDPPQPGPQPLLVRTAANYGMNSAITNGRYQTDNAPLGIILAIRSLTSLVKSQTSHMTINQRRITRVTF